MCSKEEFEAYVKWTHDKMLSLEKDVSGLEQQNVLFLAENVRLLQKVDNIDWSVAEKAEETRV